MLRSHEAIKSGLEVISSCMQVVKQIWAYIKEHNLQNPAVSCCHALLQPWLAADSL